MAKLTKTHGRKPLADGIVSLSFGRGAKGPSSYSVGVQSAEGEGFYTLSLSFAEALRLFKFLAPHLARERGWAGGSKNDERAVSDAVHFLLDTF